jgi:hypothetical protein
LSFASLFVFKVGYGCCCYLSRFGGDSHGLALMPFIKGPWCVVGLIGMWVCVTSTSRPVPAQDGRLTVVPERGLFHPSPTCPPVTTPHFPLQQTMSTRTCCHEIAQGYHPSMYTLRPPKSSLCSHHIKSMSRNPSAQTMNACMQPNPTLPHVHLASQTQLNHTTLSLKGCSTRH